MRIDISQHAEFSKYLASGLKASVQNAAAATASRIVADITTEIIPNEDRPPVDRGTYRAGWRVDEKPGLITIINTTLQAIFIEEGVRATNVKPGRAMIEGLTQWVRRKGIGGGSTKSGKPKKPASDEAKSMAWAIAKSMSGYMSKIGWVPGTGIFKGTQTPGGLRILERAMKPFDRYFREEFARELRKKAKG